MSPEKQPAPKRFLLIFNSPPYGTSAARDLLDIALTCSVFEQNISLLFLGDGVLQLLSNQHSAPLRQKNLNALHSSLAMYDIESIYVDADALAYHGIEEEQLHIDVSSLDTDTVKRLISQHDVVFTL
ncbi:MAG: sulfurtransferase complex subunit TusC [Oceanospirillales bacterium]|nr:MAG: sulfurtransferase complex subunit TusC [Oceanospirillales bacterium]